ncbi:glycerol-3-phosphate dehydrogenase [Hylemonella gracilis str. Niagara R]|uniref:Glycerol-3-phosphate dehydrogenase [NAD(P)+] n=1 Tax=Hylemonella gracilis str. Niagara R TaxID=1458275 RepID=A0A016XKZ7_9BURK|nr:NAD(P)H-dependent glycerol-3-phosphate dehydrogenase [Hylemonella gracilis]EYC52535.1 glycerol-3-phosphate dehydrogenase [Hylemonella gracilis str. Niagara R]
MNILVLGAGAWGTALAVSASGNPRQAHQVTLWARDAEQARAMQAQHVNARYLPGLPLPENLRVVDGANVAALCAQQDLVILGAPMAGLRALLQELRDCRAPVAWICKGLERSLGSERGDGSEAIALGLMAHEVQAQVAPELQAGVLSGPSFAQEVAQGQPTALVAASTHALVRERLVQAFHSPRLRVYENDDLVGVEVGGAVKNILAIATGLCDGLNLGLNARAALITRGLAEMMRFGLALGARAETFMGLSGLGDLVLTATGDLSRNRKVGLLLAQGKTLDEAVTSLGHVAEGVYCARTVAQRARHLGVDMPITEAVVALLDGEMQPQQAVQALMEREPSPEIR